METIWTGFLIISLIQKLGDSKWKSWFITEKEVFRHTMHHYLHKTLWKEQVDTNNLNGLKNRPWKNAAKYKDTTSGLESL